MREIKFRAWDKENEIMICPKGILFDGRVVNFSCGMLEAFEGYEIMQYTGLKDKNETEIYEGDILKHPTGNIAEIIYIDDLAAFVASYKISEKNEMDYLDSEIIKMCEVIGNIYENPELLEESEMRNIDKRIIEEGFHTGYEVDFVTIQQSDYEYLKEQGASYKARQALARIREK